MDQRIRNWNSILPWPEEAHFCPLYKQARIQELCFFDYAFKNDTNVDFYKHLVPSLVALF